MGRGILAKELSLLVDRCLAGDQSSFKELVYRFRGQVYGLCYRMLGQREDAEDATQETFLRVVRNLDRWDPKRAFEPWLLTIAGNRCRTRLAKRTRRPQTVTFRLSHRRWFYRGMHARNCCVKKSIWCWNRYAPSTVKHSICFIGSKWRTRILPRPLTSRWAPSKTWVYRTRQELIEKLRNRGVIDGR